MLQRKHGLMFFLFVLATLAWATPASAQETTTADQNGNFSGETSFDTTNCKGKLTVEILTDGDGVQMSANVTVDNMHASQIGSVIIVTFRGSLDDTNKAGTFWI